MRRRGRRRALLGGALALVVAVIAVTMLAPDFGENSAGAVAPAALNRIANKNDTAATAAAADMRARSAATARAADAVQDAEDRGEAAANATIARFRNQDPPAPAPTPAR